MMPMRWTFPAAFCARALSGQTVAVPAIPLMKSRRRIAFTKAGTTPNRTRLQQGFATGGMGSDHHFARQKFSEPNVRFGWRAQPVSATPLVVYRQGFRTPRSCAGVD